MVALLTILAAILVLGPLVALHEWGHYIVARLCGVKVLTYSIGFGPKLLSWKSKRTGIDYRISALPLGGYVKMLDEREGEVADEEKHLAFNNQTPLKKIAIAAAGPIMNFIIAIVLFWILFLIPSEQLSTRIGVVLPDTPAATAQLPIGDTIVAVDGKEVQSWETVNYLLADRMGETGQVTVTVEPYVVGQTNTDITHKQTQTTKDYRVNITDFMQDNEQQAQDVLSSFGMLPWQPTIAPVISGLSDEGAAIRQGMQVGDQITAVDNTPIDNWVTFTRIVRNSPEKLLTIDVLRDGQPVTLQVMPQGKKDSMGRNIGQIGALAESTGIEVPDDYKTTITYDPVTALAKAFGKTEQLAVMTLASMKKMLFGQIGLDNLSGPITIAKVAKQSFDISWQMVLSTAGLISLSLAVLNLLPIPVLDGGHILYYSIELIRGKPVSERMQIIGMNIGLLLMVGFMVLAIGNDISRFF